MTYYDEFSIPISATGEEIHAAHRGLLKLLHPDLQTTPAMRQLAEIQTRRINSMAAVLLDSERRAQYDLTINSTRVAQFRGGASYWRRAAWPALALSPLVLLLLSLSLEWSTTPKPGQPAIGSQTKAPPARTLPTTSPQPNPPSPRLPTIASAEPDPHPAVEEPGNPSPASPETEVVQAPPPASHQPPSSVPRSESPSPNDHPLTGTWVYVPNSSSPDGKNLYRPEYIEVRIRNRNGTLEGTYRARYQVPDRPLSPTVGFHFTGKSTSTSAAFPWTAANGASGNVELRLLTTSSMAVDWRVTHLAEFADLVSGTAVLTKVQ